MTDDLPHAPRSHPAGGSRSDASAAPPRGAGPGRAGLLAVRLAVLRPHLMTPALLCVAAGAAAVDLPRPPAAPAWLVLPALLCALAAAHLWNLVADRESDTRNRKNLFWHGVLAPGGLRRAAMVAAGLGLLLAAGAGMSPGGDTAGAISGARPAGYDPLPLVLVTAAVALGAAYSLERSRLAARWGWDLAANVAGYGGVAAALGVWLVGGWEPGLGEATGGGATRGIDLAAWGVLALEVAVGFLWTTLLDREGDAATGKRTWGVRFGARATLWTAATLALTSWGLAGSSPISATSLLLGAALLLVLQPGRRRLVAGVCAAVAAAGAPALARWPALVPAFALWLWVGCLVLVLAGRVRISGARRPCALGQPGNHH